MSTWNLPPGVTTNDEHINPSDKELDCGHEPSSHGEHTTGTAHTPDGREVCWSCSDDMIRADIENTALGAMLPCPLYLTKTNGRRVLSTWNGTTMLHVTDWQTRRVGFGGSRVYFRAEDEQGTRFYGTSPGEGMYARVYKSRRQS